MPDLTATETQSKPNTLLFMADQLTPLLIMFVLLTISGPVFVLFLDELGLNTNQVYHP